LQLPLLFTQESNFQVFNVQKITIIDDKLQLLTKKETRMLASHGD